MTGRLPVFVTLLVGIIGVAVANDLASPDCADSKTCESVLVTACKTPDFVATNEIACSLQCQDACTDLTEQEKLAIRNAKATVTRLALAEKEANCKDAEFCAATNEPAVACVSDSQIAAACPRLCRTGCAAQTEAELVAEKVAAEQAAAQKAAAEQQAADQVAADEKAAADAE